MYLRFFHYSKKLISVETTFHFCLVQSYTRHPSFLDNSGIMDLFFDVKPSPSDFNDLFNSPLPVMFVHCLSEVTEQQCQNNHVVVCEQNTSEFPFGCGFSMQEQDEDENELWLMLVARNLSVRLNCKSLYTGCPVDITNPYYCVIFEAGSAYLGDDMGTILMDEGDRPIEIIKRLPILDCPTKGMFRSAL